MRSGIQEAILPPFKLVKKLFRRRVFKIFYQPQKTSFAGEFLLMEPQDDLSHLFAGSRLHRSGVPWSKIGECGGV